MSLEFLPKSGKWCCQLTQQNMLSQRLLQNCLLISWKISSKFWIFFVFLCFCVIGLFDRATEGEYRWVTCDALDSWANDNWAAGQPNDLQGDQDCVQMLGSGMWNDLECSAESFYVCEVTVKGGICSLKWYRCTARCGMQEGIWDGGRGCGI